MDILQKIEASMPGFSKGQKAIGNYILEHYDKAAYMTALKLGSTVHVSESTVVRFAIELGFDGYPDLQRSLRELIRARLTSLQRIDITNDRISDDEILEKVLELDIEKMRNTLATIDKNAFNAAVDAVLKAKRIYIMGMRSSSSLAVFMNFYLSLIFDDVRLISSTSRSEMFEQLFRIGPEDIVIGISFPRYSKRIIQGMEFAKEQKAHAIAITDSMDSPLAELADHTLIARSEMESFVDSLVAPLSVINALIVAIGKKKQIEVRDIFNRLEEVWDKFEVYNKFSGQVDTK
ncbi:MAG: MurR/RpiR family transcriptional regulator [Clostridia bacterium]|nr:MurR/RpiR family transcriptional regulator [Clostridia bacterium]